MTFKLYNCDIGIKYNGVNYEFDIVDSISVNDPENTKLIRGSNGNNKIGLVYKEGIKEPKEWTMVVKGLTASLMAVLITAYNNKDRMDVYTIDRGDGSAKMARSAILCNQPQQLSLDDSPDSMNVSLMFHTFDNNEDHKS